MEIGATLAQLALCTNDPHALAGFYSATLGLQATRDGEDMLCNARGRTLRLVRGERGKLRSATFAFESNQALQVYRAELASKDLPMRAATQDGFSVTDPEGHLMIFRGPTSPEAGLEAEEVPVLPARLQHFAVRTPNPASLVDFYVQRLGFVLSDRVLDDGGALTAAFLRTDSEHHAMAIFRAPASCFDHFSCEAPDWEHLRRWADHMAHVGVDLAWGVGRHGPGNDTFFMVRDRDGNMAEISCDLEVCSPDRPSGIWPHRPQTLNQWGVAIMRS